MSPPKRGAEFGKREVDSSLCNRHHSPSCDGLMHCGLSLLRDWARAVG